MSQNYNSGLTTTQTLNVTGGTTNLPVEGIGQVIKSVSNGKNGTSVTAGTGLQLLSVTPGKTFYCQSLTVNGIGGAINFEVRDGTIAGTLKAVGVGGVTTANNMIFPTPLKFSTAVFLDTNATQTVCYIVVGWEQ